MRDKVFAIVAAVMTVPGSSVTIDSSPKNVGHWDSLRHMNLILAVEEAFGVELTDDEIIAIGDVRTLVGVLEAKGVR